MRGAVSFNFCNDAAAASASVHLIDSGDASVRKEKLAEKIARKIKFDS